MWERVGDARKSFQRGDQISKPNIEQWVQRSPLSGKKVYEFPRTAIPKDHRLAGFEQQEHIVSQFFIVLNKNKEDLYYFIF